MTIDKYTKFLLTLIAVGIIGINFHLFKGSVVKDAFAVDISTEIHVTQAHNNTRIFIKKELDSIAMQLRLMDTTLFCLNEKNKSYKICK